MGLGCQPGVESLARAIQLSVSPVFLLAGISGLLGHAPELSPALRHELQLQRRRLRLVIAAITLATLSFLTVATLVILLFVGVVTGIDLSAVVAVLFMLAMGLLMAAVFTLVLEIRLGSRIASNF
jgi:hypothetical protein